MSNKRKNRKKTRGSKKRTLGRAFNETKLAANVTEEQDWYLDTPDVRLTRIFSVVLILHVVAVGGILAFKMIDKASVDTGIQIASAKTTPSAAMKKETEVAAKIPASKKASAPAAKPATAKPAKAEIAAPLKRDPTKANQYRVLMGDTLVEIAKKLSIDPDALRQKNAITSDSALYPGRWLDIPSKDEQATNKVGAKAKPKPKAAAPAEAKAKPKTVGNTVSAASANVYEVQSGDTLWGISRKFSLSYQELIVANGIDNPAGLQIGQKLKIPTKK